MADTFGINLSEGGRRRVEDFKKKHGFKSDEEVIKAMIGVVLGLDEGANAQLRFLKNGQWELETRSGG